MAQASDQHSFRCQRARGCRFAVASKRGLGSSTSDARGRSGSHDPKLDPAEHVKVASRALIGPYMEANPFRVSPKSTVAAAKGTGVALE
jgi:hypothetical protein